MNFIFIQIIMFNTFTDSFININNYLIILYIYCYYNIINNIIIFLFSKFN